MRKVRILDPNDESLSYLTGCVGLANVSGHNMLTVRFLKGDNERNDIVAHIDKVLLLEPKVEDLGNVTVKQATEVLYRDMSQEFSGLDLIKRVRWALSRPDVYNDTVLRKMRKLKAEGKINFRCIDYPRSLYEKL